jgi:hypothetical protein
MKRDGRPPGDLFLSSLLYTCLAAGKAQLLKQQKVRPVMKKGFTEIVFILDRSFLYDVNIGTQRKAGERKDTSM